jgi:hypothetical protein
VPTCLVRPLQTMVTRAISLATEGRRVVARHVGAAVDNTNQYM